MFHENVNYLILKFSVHHQYSICMHISAWYTVTSVNWATSRFPMFIWHFHTCVKGFRWKKWKFKGNVWVLEYWRAVNKNFVEASWKLHSVQGWKQLMFTINFKYSYWGMIYCRTLNTWEKQGSLKPFSSENTVHPVCVKHVLCMICVFVRRSLLSADKSMTHSRKT